MINLCSKFLSVRINTGMINAPVLIAISTLPLWKLAFLPRNLMGTIFFPPPPSAVMPTISFLSAGSFCGRTGR